VFENLRRQFGFRRLERIVWASIRENYDRIYSWSGASLDQCQRGESTPSVSDDPVVATGGELRSTILNRFRNRFASWKGMKFLVHIPPPVISPAGFSFFSNLVASLDFMGISVRRLEWDERIEEAFAEFSPSIFLSSDSETYLSRIAWDKVAAYRERFPLLIGLTASLEEYGNTPLTGRLSWARKNGVSFFYSFRAAEYIRQRKAYNSFFSEGYPILTLEFGANPLIHFPVANPEKMVDYVFLASTNYDKRARYLAYLPEIMRHHKGFVGGPGWSFPREYCFEPARDRFVYACGKVGLNLSIEEQLELPCELNERTYILAACGIPQLIDNPALLPRRFSTDALFSACSPREYRALLNEILNNREAAAERALKALQEVFERHTTFHRLEDFLHGLAVNFPMIAGNPEELHRIGED
jgi:Glycosyl transferases group 1